MPKKWVVRNSPASPYQSGSPDTEGWSENAPRGCLSSPTAMARSASPSLIALAAIASEVAPVAQPVKTARPGIPVSPSRPTIASGFFTYRLPSHSVWIAGHSTPASISAAKTACAPIARADLPGWRPKGCRPTPMIATSLGAIVASLLGDRGEGVDHGLVSLGVRAEGHDPQLHLLPDAQLFGVGLGQAGLDLQRPRKLAVARREGLERLGGVVARIRRRGGPEALGGEG